MSSTGKDAFTAHPALVTADALDEHVRVWANEFTNGELNALRDAAAALRRLSEQQVPLRQHDRYPGRAG